MIAFVRKNQSLVHRVIVVAEHAIGADNIDIVNVGGAEDARGHLGTGHTGTGVDLEVTVVDALETAHGVERDGHRSEKYEQ